MILRQEKQFLSDLRKAYADMVKSQFQQWKIFWKTLTSPPFWLVEFFLPIFYACYTYLKYLLESKPTFDTS